MSIEIIEADVMDYSCLTKALKGCDVAYYLIHPMTGSSPQEWKKFAERDRKAAENFSKAATECRVDRIIYLGGLIHANDVLSSNKKSSNISEHMKAESR